MSKETEPITKGRPTKYNAQFHPLLVEALAGQGLTETQISERMGISEATLNNWKNKYPLFLESIKRGKESPDDIVEKKLFELATGYEQTVIRPIVVSCGNGMGSEIIDHEVVEKIPPVPTAQIFWLKNRRPAKWRDKQDIEMSGGLTVKTQDLSKLSDTELADLEKMLIKIEPNTNAK